MQDDIIFLKNEIKIRNDIIVNLSAAPTGQTRPKT